LSTVSITACLARLKNDFTFWKWGLPQKEGIMGCTNVSAMTQLEMLGQAISIAIENEKRVSVLEAKVETITSNSGYFTIKAYARLNSFQLPNAHAAKIGKKCAQLCRERNLQIGNAKDETYGIVKTYPESVIAEVVQQIDKSGTSDKN
jgi:hypothetical protein